METAEEIKEVIREKYSLIAEQSRQENAASCCGVGTGSSCCTIDYAVFAEDYSALGGYVPDADLGLGCGIPTEFAQLKTGQKVLDLGSGAGNDCFIAREIVGDKGKVIGVDMTETMIEKARTNADKLGFYNVEFRLGEIEKLPVAGNSIDVVISNCVLNLVPNKAQAFAEMFRVLKNGGHFSVSDVVLEGNLPEKLRSAAEMYVGCVSGAIQKEEYLHLLAAAGFTEITVQKAKEIVLPDEILQEYLTVDAISEYRAAGGKVWSITVYGEKPAACCSPESGCC